MKPTDNKVIKLMKKFWNSEITQLIISIICGLLISVIIENTSYSIQFIEAGLAGVISYIVIHTIKNQSGKLSKALEENNTVIQQSKDALETFNHSSNYNDLSKQPITILLKHLADESFGKCSNRGKSCEECSRYKSTSDGLLRTYLREDCENLVDSIEAVNNKKEYKLDNNISFYHTLAIDQLKLMKGVYYRVIQTLLGGDETLYDDMDIDFLKKFIEEIFQKEYEKAGEFQVQWIFVGEHSKEKAKNNYKYLIDELNDQSDEIKNAFTFKTLPQDAFKRIKNQNLRIGKTRIDDYYTNDPSLGIFGNGFAFVDALPKGDQHGIMYSDSQTVRNLLEFYEILWISTEAKITNFEVLKNYANSK